MSSYYGIVFPEFWTGPTGKAIRAEGKDAQILALYLVTCRYASMLGLYRLLVDDVKLETGIGLRGLSKAFAALQRLQYADYDAATEHVWVREMAKFRLGLQKASPLNTDDNRVKGAQNLYDRLNDNPFLGAFFDRYGKEIRLRRRRDCGGLSAQPLDVAPSKPLASPLKPDNRIRDQVQGSEIRKSTDAARRPFRSVENTDGTFPLYCVIAKEARGISIRDDGSDSISNVTAIFKQLCADRALTYDSGEAARAIEAACRSVKAS